MKKTPAADQAQEYGRISMKEIDMPKLINYGVQRQPHRVSYTPNSARKTCWECGHRRRRSQFYSSPHTPDGLMNYCRICFDKAVNALYAKYEMPHQGMPSTKSIPRKTCQQCHTRRRIYRFPPDAASKDGVGSVCLNCWRYHR